jgi:type I restriction enzyme M protein
LLYLEKRERPDIDFEDSYKVTVCQLTSLGYEGSGEKIRGFNKALFIDEIGNMLLDQSKHNARKGYCWNAFDIEVKELYQDSGYRFDYKYWDPEVRNKIKALVDKGCPTLKEINIIQTARGKSPSADSYVDEQDGYALVVKAGSNISKYGKIILEDSDWIEQSIYEEFVEKAVETETNGNIIQKGDILLSSTGDGTLGKCCVYDLDKPAIADGHVTIIRVNSKKINPYYLADYLRNGFGALQIQRFFTGSTGLIELTPDHVDRIIVDLRKNKKEQSNLSKRLRQIEDLYLKKLKEAEVLL